MDTLPNGWCSYYLIQTLFPIETPVGQWLKRPIFWRGVCSNLICSQEIFRSIPSFSPKLFGILGMFLGENLPCVVQKINIASPTSNLRGADPFFGSGGGGGGGETRAEKRLLLADYTYALSVLSLLQSEPHRRCRDFLVSWLSTWFLNFHISLLFLFIFEGVKKTGKNSTYNFVKIETSGGQHSCPEWNKSVIPPVSMIVITEVVFIVRS